MKHSELIRSKKPLILNLTNAVTMDMVANTLLAVGAAPLMTQSEDELEELVAMASAVVINIGTLDQAFVSRCQSVLPMSKPLVLDPVGAGATRLRTEAAKLLAPHATIIKGNASEILALANHCQHTQGVESAHQTAQATQAADELAGQQQCVVVVSGETDYITDGSRSALLSGGAALMARVTGMGCSLAGVIAAFHAVIGDGFVAAETAVRFFNQCGEWAAQRATAPGSFRTQFIDALYQVDGLCD